MYWWNTSKLAEDLRDGRVDEKERFKYYLAMFIGWNLLAQLLSYYGGPFEIKRLIPVTMNLAVTAFGAFLCYRANKSGDNADFIGRMICLGWPSAIRTIALYLAIFSILLIAFSPLESDTTISEALGRFLRWALWILIWGYFNMILLHLAYVAQPIGSEKAQQTKKMVRFTEKTVIGLFGFTLGGSIIWVVIARFWLPEPFPGFWGITLIGGVVSLTWLWVRRLWAKVFGQVV